MRMALRMAITVFGYYSRYCLADFVLGSDFYKQTSDMLQNDK